MALLGQPGPKEPGVVWFGKNDATLGTFITQHTRDASNGPTRAISGHPVIKTSVFKIRENFSPGCCFMNIGIRTCFKLSRKEPAVLLGEGLRSLVHANTSLFLRRQYHLCAEKSHEPSAFYGKTLGHRNDQGISLSGAHHSEPYSGVTGSGFNNSLPG